MKDALRQFIDRAFLTTDIEVNHDQYDCARRVGGWIQDDRESLEKDPERERLIQTISLKSDTLWFKRDLRRNILYAEPVLIFAGYCAYTLYQILTK